MQRTAWRRRLRLLDWAGAGVYALFLVTAPFEHHDLVCHLKTPFHCTSCTSTAVGADPRTPPVVGEWALADAGRATTAAPVMAGALLPVRSCGRSPPSFA